MNKKNIWIFNQYAGDSTSGWGERSFYLAEEFQKQNYDVTIFSGSQNHLFTNNKNINSSYEIRFDNNVRFVWIKTLKYYKSNGIKRVISWFIFIIKIFMVSKTNLPKPDYIIVSSMPMLPIFCAQYYKKKYQSKKLIFEVRDIWPLTLTEIGGKSRFNPFVILLSSIERYSYNKSDLIISVLKNCNLHIKKVTNNKFNFLWIPNGIKEKLTTGQVNVDIHSLLKLIPNDKFLIFYAGSLNKTNAMSYVVKAANMLKTNEKIHFVFVGEGDQKEYLKSISNSHNLTFIPKVPKHQLKLLISKASCYIISWKNSKIYNYGVSPNKYADYMLQGKPIIVATNSKCDIVEEANCGLIARAQDHLSIVDKITELLNFSEEKRKILGLNGLKYAQKNLLYEKLSLKYLKALES